MHVHMQALNQMRHRTALRKGTGRLQWVSIEWALQHHHKEVCCCFATAEKRKSTTAPAFDLQANPAACGTRMVCRGPKSTSTFGKPTMRCHIAAYIAVNPYAMCWVCTKLSVRRSCLYGTKTPNRVLAGSSVAAEPQTTPGRQHQQQRRQHQPSQWAFVIITKLLSQ
jgi:hypothetical protein